MFEIAPHSHLPIARLLALAIPAAAVGVLLLLLAGQGAQLRRLLVRALLVGIACAAASAALRSSRGAGTGTQTAWGWPRAVHTRWVSWESAERRGGVRWLGLAENTIFYGAVATLAGGALAVARRRSGPVR